VTAPFFFAQPTAKNEHKLQGVKKTPRKKK